MMKIGLLVGRERSFPDALIAEINSRNSGVVAEYIKVGEIPSEQQNPYRVILDRISHEVIFYQPYLKAAVVSGTTVINNPFWKIADDKFFGTTLLQRLGVAVPKTVILPSQSYPESIIPESLSNLTYPLNWNAVIEYTGFPAILKPHYGGGWRDVHRVDSVEQLLAVYNQTGQLCMMLQEFIQWDQYVRCLCIGKRRIRITNWDPRKSHFERYRDVQQDIDPVLARRIEADAITINEALGYDMNTIEFGIRAGIPYAIDFMNSAPDFDISSLTEQYFPWVVENMANLLIEKATAAQQETRYRWDHLL